MLKGPHFVWHILKKWRKPKILKRVGRQLKFYIMGFFQKFKDIQKSVKEIKESGGLGDYLATKAEQKTEELKQSVKEKLSNRNENPASELMDEMLQETENMRGEISRECEKMRREISQECEDMRREISHKSIDMGYDEQLEKLIDLALADGELTEKERNILFKRAEALGVDLDEFEMVLDNRLNEIQKQQPKQESVSPEEKDDIVQTFFDQLSSLEEKQQEVEYESDAWEKIHEQKVRIIKEHPIPHSKEGLLQMLALAAPQAKKVKFGFFTRDGYEEDIYSAWRKKCSQIITQARIFLKEDPKALGIVEEYAKKLEL